MSKRKKSKKRNGYIPVFSGIPSDLSTDNDRIHFTSLTNQQEAALWVVLQAFMKQRSFQIPDIKQRYTEYVRNDIKDYDLQTDYMKIFEEKRWWPDFIQKLKTKKILHPVGVKLGKQTYTVSNINWWIKTGKKHKPKKKIIRPDIDKLTSLQGRAVYEVCLSIDANEYISVNRTFRRMPRNTLTKKQISSKISCLSDPEKAGIYCLKRLVRERRIGEPQRYELFERNLDYVPMMDNDWEKLNLTYMGHYGEKLVDHVRDFQSAPLSAPKHQEKLFESNKPQQKEDRMTFKELQEAGVLMDTEDVGNCINSAMNDLKKRLEEALLDLEIAEEDLKSLEQSTKKLKSENQNLKATIGQNNTDLSRYKEKFDNIREQHGSQIFDPASL